MLVENISDQGGWGEQRAFHWHSETAEFIDIEILAIAKENGWKMVEKTIISEPQLESWVYQTNFPTLTLGFPSQCY